MKITGMSVNKVISIYGVNKSKIEKEKEVLNTDTFEVSKLGMELSVFDNEEVSSVSSKRIEEIKDQISKGTYRIDSKLIAKKMIFNYRK